MLSSKHAMTARAYPPDTAPEADVSGEQHFLVHGVSWQDYELLRDTLDVPGLRITYCEGTLELMSPSREHEIVKSVLGRLIELFALERDIPLYAYGQTTFRREAKQRG